LKNTALEKIMRDAQLETKGTIHNKSIQILAYDDDNDTVSSVKEAFLALSAAAKTIRVNEEKTKLMQVTKRPITLSERDTGSYNFETV
jgi:hypothetical protein